MWRTPQRLLMTYAAVLAGLGILLAVVDGFADGWRIVGANVALLVAGCAVIAKLGAHANRRAVVTAASWVGIACCAFGAFNFLRLSIKWHQAQQVLMPESLAAALMGLAGLLTAVLLWRLVVAASHHSWTWHVRRLGTAAGMLAMIAGFIMTKAATLPQSASAMVQTAITGSDMAERLADTAVGQHLVESALRSDAVSETLRKRGLSEQQIERLAEDPQLRAAAFKLLRAGAGDQENVDLASLAAALNGQQADDSSPMSAMTRTEAAYTGAALDHAAGMSRQKLRQLGRSLNINAADLGITESAAAPLSIDDLEQHMNNPRVQELLRHQTDDATIHRTHVPTTNSLTKTQFSTGAERVRPERVEHRLAAEPFDTIASIGALPIDDTSPDIDRGVLAPALPESTQPRPAIVLGLLDRTVLAESGRSQTHVTLPAIDASSSRVRASASAAAHQATPAVSSADVAAVAEIVQSTVLQDATLPAGSLPNTSHWRLAPGFSLSRTGVVVLIIGGTIILCCIALGRNEKKLRAQPI